MSLTKQLIAGLVAVAVSSALFAQGYPTKPITLVVGFPPGGGADNVARNFSDALSRELGQPVIIDNKAGAGTTIAAGAVARAAPDGYTLYLGNASLMGSDNLLYKVAYTPNDFVPITRLTVAPLLLIASKQSGITSVADLLDRAKKQPGKLNYASSGSGIVTHLAGVYFTQLAKVDITHIPFKGGAPAVQSIASGDTQLAFATIGSARPMIEGGKATAIAVTSAQKSSLLPQYPTIAENGVKGYDLVNWWGIFAPAKTPANVTEKLFTALQKVMTSPDLKAKLAPSGEEVFPSKSMAEFKAFAVKEGKLNADLIRASGAKID